MFHIPSSVKTKFQLINCAKTMDNIFTLSEKKSVSLIINNFEYMKQINQEGYILLQFK